MICRGRSATIAATPPHPEPDEAYGSLATGRPGSPRTDGSRRAMTLTSLEATPAPIGNGLSDAEAHQRLVRDGPNELPVSEHRGVLRLLREVVSEPMFLLLVACGAIYMLLGDRQEALMLLGFVFVVMGISFSQQRRSEKSLDALR